MCAPEVFELEVASWLKQITFRNRLYISHSQDGNRSVYSLAVTGHLSLRFLYVNALDVASEKARPRSPVGRQCVCILQCWFLYTRGVGGTKSSLDCVRDDELPPEASN